MSVDDSQGSAHEPASSLPVATARPTTATTAVDGRGIMIDPRMMFVGGAVALVGLAVLALFLWMVPTAAARELQAACRGLRAEAELNPALCPNGTSCSAPTPAPDFTAKDITGKDVKLSDYRGKVVLLNFWASWCGVCKTEKPALNAMASEMASSDDFVVLALASDHAWPDALTGVLDALAPQAVPPGKPTMEKVGAAFRQALPSGIPFKVLLDPPAGDENIGKITASWGIKAVPESALIDRKGNIRAYFVNKRDWQSPVAETCLRSVIDGD
ncbi:MAG TPA: TlpA disulfide reductase family protein [Kofleriaceae bacterium]|nr:TlpA disulfide reductase family protein [Kofleriaceae bacterium]